MSDDVESVGLSSSLEERLSQVCSRLEHASKRLQIGDHMMALLEHDNSMCLYALRAFAKKLEAEEVEEKLADHIEKRAVLFEEIRGAIRKIGSGDTIRPASPHEFDG